MPESHQVESLRSAFDVVEVESLADAEARAADDPEALILHPPAGHGKPSLPGGLAPEAVPSILEHIGEAVGVIDADGQVAWANARLRACDEDTRERFVRTCRHAIDQFNQAGRESVALAARPGSRFTFTSGDAHFETMVSIAAVDDSEDSRVTAIVGILWEVTSSRELQKKIDAIDAAGSELMRIETGSIAKLNMAERLVYLEKKIIRYVHELLSFDKFEIRLIDPESRALELVFNLGLTPLKIGEVLYAEMDENGISGYVAATGQSYLCPDVSRDVRYRDGLTDAASALTVPLRLHDRIIGVFNIESSTIGAFTENDRRFAQIFGRYIAMAMHILDLLVVERYTTNEQVTENVLTELDRPLQSITERATELRRGLAEADERTLSAGLDAIIEAAGGIRRRLTACTDGPRSIIGAEQELERRESEPAMIGKHIILADNEPVILEAIRSLLCQVGCDVTACASGSETIERLHEAHRRQERVDLVISDIRMPDRTGYDVFRTAKEIDADTPVILITGFGYDPHHSIVRASQEGLHSFLFKPLQASLLLEAVAKAFGEAS